MEEARLRLRRQLEDTFGVEEASILMDRPPGGWNDLVTNQSLAREMDALRAELRGEMGELRAELRGEMGELRAELRGEMAEMRTEMRGSLRSEIAELSASIDRRLRAQTWITTTTMLTGMGLVAAFTRL
jgi:hypothetical protein